LCLQLPRPGPQAQLQAHYRQALQQLRWQALQGQHLLQPLQWPLGQALQLLIALGWNCRHSQLGLLHREQHHPEVYP
jgi:hypothetical protein